MKLPAGLEPAELPADAIEVGRIADAWGIKGWFKVLPHSASPEALFSSKRWYLLPTERGAKTFSGAMLLRVREAKEHSDTVVAQAQDVDDRTAAEALKGARIFVPRSSFPTAATDEFYWVDLIGLSVVNREGVELGRVKELLSTGAQTVLVIEYEEAGKPAERMIPFVAVYVDSVDLAAKRITVDWQPDY
jgi:16S rRNA processing protein RimM